LCPCAVGRYLHSDCGDCGDCRLCAGWAPLALLSDGAAATLHAAGHGGGAPAVQSCADGLPYFFDALGFGNPHQEVAWNGLSCDSSKTEANINKWAWPIYSGKHCFNKSALWMIDGAYISGSGNVVAPDILEVLGSGLDQNVPLLGSVTGYHQFWHCDNGDSQGTRSSYGQSRGEAWSRLTQCFQHVLSQRANLVALGGQIVDADLEVTSRAATIDAETGVMGCPPPTYTGVNPGTDPLCQFYFGLGAIIHTVSDFYSHSNYAEQGQSPIGLDLGAPFDGFDDNAVNTGILSTRPSKYDNLMTGCVANSSWEDIPVWPESDDYDAALYSLPTDDSCASGGSRDFTHEALNKDKVSTTRGAMVNGNKAGATNFSWTRWEASVETAHQWRYILADLEAAYGATRANKIACVVASKESNCY